MQEVNRFPFFEEALRRAGYEGVFFAKLHSPCEGLGFPADGCALFWRGTLLEAAAPADAAPYVGAGGAALNQGRLIQLLRERATGDLLLAATTHLKAKEDSEGVRALEAAQLVAALRSAGGEGAAGRLGGVPVVLCGDFNDSPGSRAARRPSSVATLPLWLRPAMRADARKPASPRRLRLSLVMRGSACATRTAPFPPPPGSISLPGSSASRRTGGSPKSGRS